jgi:ABC-type sugar transport system ATPase subunit
VSTRADRGNGAAARPLLVVDGIETFYGSIQALKGVSFEVPEGSIVTLLGANGAGKSTTLKSISGLVPPARGTVAFTGQRIDGLASEKIVRLGISHVPEGRELFTELTVLENLKMGAYTARTVGRSSGASSASSRTSGPRQAQLDGFDLHANVWVPPQQSRSPGAALSLSAPPPTRPGPHPPPRRRARSRQTQDRLARWHVSLPLRALRILGEAGGPHSPARGEFAPVSRRPRPECALALAGRPLRPPDP